jgi:nucleoside recognition membrane protein YjiH
MEMLTTGLRFIFHLIHIPQSLSTSIINGFFEVTLGAKSAGQANETIPLVYKLAAAAFILSWGGLSVHAQVVSILHRTNIRYITFAIARLIHAILAACLVFLIWKPLKPIGEIAAPVFTNIYRHSWIPWGIHGWVTPVAFLLGVIVLLTIIDYDEKRMP